RIFRQFHHDQRFRKQIGKAENEDENEQGYVERMEKTAAIGPAAPALPAKYGKINLDAAEEHEKNKAQQRKQRQNRIFFDQIEPAFADDEPGHDFGHNKRHRLQPQLVQQYGQKKCNGDDNHE